MQCPILCLHSNFQSFIYSIFQVWTPILSPQNEFFSMIEVQIQNVVSKEPLEIRVKINKEMTEVTLNSRIFTYCALWGQVCSNQSCKNYKAVAME